MSKNDLEVKAQKILEDLISEMAAQSATEALSETLAEKPDTEATGISYEAFKANILSDIKGRESNTNKDTTHQVAEGVQEGLQAGKLSIRATLKTGLKSLKNILITSANEILPDGTPALAVAGMRKRKPTDKRQPPAQSTMPNVSILSTLVPMLYTEKPSDPDVHILTLLYFTPDTSQPEEPKITLWLDRKELEFTTKFRPNLNKSTLQLYFSPDQYPESVEVTTDENTWIVRLVTTLDP